MNPNRPLQNQRQSQRRPPEKKQAAATLRSRAAGSQDESPGRAIHKIKGKFKGESTARSGCATKSKESAQARLPVPRSQRKAHRQDCLCHEVKGKRTGKIACATKSKTRGCPSSPPPAGSQDKQGDCEGRRQRPSQRRPAKAGRYKINSKVKSRSTGRIAYATGRHDACF